MLFRSALGTVADVAALHGLNRAFVAQGLKVMARREGVGMAALIIESVSACGSALANDNLIERFSSSTRHAIFTNVVLIVSNVAPRQRDRRGAASRTECKSQ